MTGGNRGDFDDGELILTPTQRFIPIFLMRVISSLTPKSVLAGTKNSHLESFWLAKHKHTNTPTIMEPFSPPAAWFCWLS